MSEFNENLVAFTPHTVQQTDANGNPATQPNIVDSSNVNSIDYNDRLTFDDVNVPSIDYGGRILYDNSGGESILWANRILYDASTLVAVDYANRALMSSSGLDSIDWENRTLDAVSATVLDYSGVTYPSASIAMDSTTQGVLFPRMTTTQKNAIASPAEGLTVYDLTLHQLSYFNGTAWVNI